MRVVYPYVSGRVLPSMRREAVTRCAAVVAWGAICAAVLWSDDWEPLAGPIGWIAALLATVALGLMLRWSGVLIVAIGFIVVAVVVRPGAEQLETVLLVVFVLPVLAASAGIAAFVARWIDGSRPGAVVLAGALVATTIGLVLNARTVDHRPEAPVAIDLSTGAFADIRLGAAASSLRATRGTATVTRVPTTRLITETAPLGQDSRDLSGPSAMDVDFKIHRFERVAVFVHRGRLVGYVTTDPNVELGKGVGVGDSISLIEDRGLPFACEGVSLGSDATRPSYPACSKPVRGGAVLWVGGDPIDSIWVAR